MGGGGFQRVQNRVEKGFKGFKTGGNGLEEASAKSCSMGRMGSVDALAGHRRAAKSRTFPLLGLNAAEINRGPL